MATRHIPVLLKETFEILNLKKGDVAVDATLGGGGHTLAILERILPGGTLIALDTDQEAIERFKKDLEKFPWAKSAFTAGKLRLYHRNFSELEAVLREEGIEKVVAILADLGFSSDQIEDRERGLSFLQEGPLDMRFDRGKELTAGIIVNTYSEKELAHLIKEYGDERLARVFARTILRERPLQTTTQLARIIERAVPKRAHKIHPATKTFQALRIAVNREAEHFESFLPQALSMLELHGRLAVISFHSGEDAKVKRVFRENARGCICPDLFPVCRCGRAPIVKVLTKKPIKVSQEEIGRNPRARSARLRVAEKIWVIR